MLTILLWDSKERKKQNNFLMTSKSDSRNLGWKSPKRKPMVARKPKIESRNKFLRNVKTWLKKCMHTSIPWQKEKLSIRLNGYYRYFGLRHCIPALEHVKYHVERLWITTLRRRSQRHNLHWSTVTKQAWFRLPEPFLKR